MPGTTGKRARPAGKCFRCGAQISDQTFERSRAGDSHAMSPDGVYHCGAQKMRRLYVAGLVAALDVEIREHENFLAFHSIVIEAAEKRLAAYRAIRAELLAWDRPESCSCARGGRAQYCECQDWPDARARRMLRGEPMEVHSV